MDCLIDSPPMKFVRLAAVYVMSINSIYCTQPADYVYDDSNNENEAVAQRYSYIVACNTHTYTVMLPDCTQPENRTSERLAYVNIY